MALFVLIAIDKPKSLALRLSVRGEHFEWANARAEQIRLGGPFLDEAGEMAGSLMIFEAKDLAAARAFHASDPYLKAGLFETTEIRPWKATFKELP
ncbi:MAG: YciI family protein [Caulobacteraceae bacterium]